VGALLEGSDVQLKKGRAIVAYAKALVDASKSPQQASAAIDEALAAADLADPGQVDPELQDIRGLLNKYRTKF